METDADGTKAQVERLLERARAEVEAGRAWRAKEIFRGSVAQPHLVVEVDVLRAYGELLDRLGDRFEAGKYLFLSGSTEPWHAAAIEVFMRRTRHLEGAVLISQFPRALRRQGLGNLPESVRGYLEERGVPTFETRRGEPLESTTLASEALGWGCLIAFMVATGVLLVAVAVGLITMARWLS